MSSKKRRDLSITVVAFYMKIIGCWLASNRAEESRRKVAMIYTIIAMVSTVAIEMDDLYNNWGNISETIYTVCNILSILLVVFKILISFIHKKEFLNLIQHAKTNFWDVNSDYNVYEQGIMDNTRRICVFFVCAFAFFNHGVVISYAVAPIITNIGKGESERILPFKMTFFDLPFSMTPYYEIAFAFQVFTLYPIAAGYVCIDNFLGVLNLHIAGQFRILQYRLRNVCNTNESEDYYKNSKHLSYIKEEYTLLKILIQQHQELIEYCRRLENMFGMIVLGEVLVFSLLICLDGYLILMENSSRRLVFIFHLGGCMYQLLIFTYSCDCLMRESLNVANAGYESSWQVSPMNKDGQMLRKDLQFVIMRSQTPCCLTAKGFSSITLETYLAILSTAVSYFTVLRNQIEFQT